MYSPRASAASQKTFLAATYNFEKYEVNCEPSRLRFYYIARGSLEEVLSAFIICDKVGYTSNELSRQRELCGNAVRALNGYIRYVRNQKRGQKEYGDRVVSDEVVDYETNFTPLGEE